MCPMPWQREAVETIVEEEEEEATTVVGSQGEVDRGTTVEREPLSKSVDCPTVPQRANWPTSLTITM